jgi:hypothetical protein
MAWLRPATPAGPIRVYKSQSVAWHDMVRMASAAVFMPAMIHYQMGFTGFWFFIAH